MPADCAYEIQRQENIKQNEEKIRSLGISKLIPVSPSQRKTQRVSSDNVAIDINDVRFLVEMICKTFALDSMFVSIWKDHILCHMHVVTIRRSRRVGNSIVEYTGDDLPDDDFKFETRRKKTKYSKKIQTFYW